MWQQLAETHDIESLRTNLANFQAFVNQSEFTVQQIPDSAQL